MLKKMSVLFMGLLMALMFCACDSEEVKQAKEDFAAGHYTQVVKDLDGQENLSQEAQDMLAISEANVAYENEDYLVAVKTLTTASTGNQTEQFEEMFNAALEDAISNKSADDVIELLKLDESKADAVFDVVTKTCEAKDYNGFIVLDGLVEKLDDSDLKTKLSDFDEEYKILRAEAFMVGSWEWQHNDDEVLTRVKVIPYEDNLIGRITKVGSDLKTWHYKKDDVYWEKFEFENGKKFICYNLTRYEDGTVAGQTATGKINYKKGTVELNVTSAEDQIRIWKRLDK